jgi:beta-xylosidase
MKRFISLVITALLLSAFAPLAISIQTASPIEVSAASVQPTGTPAAKPQSADILFRDDFTDELQAGWKWENENKDKWSLTDDGMLQIIGENDSLIGQGRQNNLLWHDLPEGDFNIATHIVADPKENFQQAAIYLYEDPKNFVTINRGFCGPCGGSGFYMDYKVNGDQGTYRVSSTKSDIYLRLESKNKIISGYYSTEPDKWIRLGRVGNFFKFKKVGLGVSNAGAAGFDLIGQYDWFEISKAK